MPFPVIERRATGRFYTPAEIAEKLVRRTLEPLAGAPHVCDPACGDGALLIQAWRFLSERMGDMAAQRCLHGWDTDPFAVAEARRRLPESNIHIGDAFDADLASFDAVVCNPPFIHAIGSGISTDTKARLRHRFPDVTGAADLAYYFAALAHAATRPDGTVGLILPRAFLSAPAARKLRERFSKERPPSLIHCPPCPRLFEAASVRVTAVVLGGGVSVVRSDDWWSGTTHSDTTALGDRFEVMASLTAAMAYDLLPYLVEEQQGDRPRLVTTGLIDADECLWGRKQCRYLKRNFVYPRIDLRSDMPQSLLRRLERLGRPKLLVAGVAGPGGRVEAFVDREGSFRGAVSTYSILDAADDVIRLQSLADILNGDDTARRVAERLGASAMGAGLITVTKAFLRGLPQPR